jgi:hypothetical protein
MIIIIFTTCIISNTPVLSKLHNLLSEAHECSGAWREAAKNSRRGAAMVERVVLASLVVTLC